MRRHGIRNTEHGRYFSFCVCIVSGQLVLEVLDSDLDGFWFWFP